MKGFKEGETRRGSQDCKDEYTSEEEVVTAVCLKQNLGVKAQTTLDDTGKELISVGEPEDTLLWNRTEQGEWCKLCTVIVLSCDLESHFSVNIMLL